MKTETQGVVIETSGDMAKVKSNRHGDCKNCGACPGDNATVLDVQNPLGAKPGQRVVFEIKEENMLKAAFVVYILPIIAIFLGSMFGAWLAPKLGQPEKILQIGGAIIAFILSVLYIKVFDRATNKNNKSKPIIKRIL
jgi:sigma-E factor negative regulatory protein RseC